MAYPDKINALVDVSADETLAAGGHAARHNDVNDALDELEAVFTAPAANELALRPDGTNQRFHIDSSGDVTITGDISFDGGTDLTTALASKLDLAGGKILQIVRATDTTQRNTTSTSFVDASLSVTITPQKSDSAILLLYFAQAGVQWSTVSEVAQRGEIQITDNSNNAISGAEAGDFGASRLDHHAFPAELRGYVALAARSTPATTSATTYKVRYRSQSANVTMRLKNTAQTGQLYAIEVSA